MKWRRQRLLIEQCSASLSLINMPNTIQFKLEIMIRHMFKVAKAIFIGIRSLSTRWAGAGKRISPLRTSAVRDCSHMTLSGLKSIQATQASASPQKTSTLQAKSSWTVNSMYRVYTVMITSACSKMSVRPITARFQISLWRYLTGKHTRSPEPIYSFPNLS